MRSSPTVNVCGPRFARSFVAFSGSRVMSGAISRPRTPATSPEPSSSGSIVAGSESLPPDRVVCLVYVRRLRNEVPVKVDANDLIIVLLLLVSAEGREVRVSWEGLKVRGESESEDAQVDESAASQSEAFHGSALPSSGVDYCDPRGPHLHRPLLVGRGQEVQVGSGNASHDEAFRSTAGAGDHGVQFRVHGAGGIPFVALPKGGVGVLW